MTDISDRQISVLCDGYVEVEDEGARNAKALPKYKLTIKAERLLTLHHARG